MCNLKQWSLLIIALSFFQFAHATDGMSRRDLKRMCKEQFKECKKDQSTRVCRKQKKQCRVDNKVTFKDDIKHFKQQILNFGKKAAGHVQIELEEDNIGEYITLRFISKKIKNIGDFTYIPRDMYSHVSIRQDEDGAKLEFKVYTKDLEKRGVGQELQTSVGRLFPKFIDGVKHESLWGEVARIAGGDVQIYFDPDKKLFGAFIPSAEVGQFISWVNETKNSTKYLSWLPDLNSIPVNIKLDKTKVGRVSVLSRDSNGVNSGIIILFDHSKIVEVLRNK